MLRVWLSLMLVGWAWAQSNGSSTSGGDSCVTEEEVVLKLLSDERVDLKREGQVQSEVTFWVQTVGPFDGQSINLYFYLDQTWQDDRVNWDITKVCGSPKTITVRGAAMGKFWRPDLGFVQASEGAVLESPFQNDFLLIYPDGKVWANQRVHVKSPCVHDWQAFPRDTVTCTLLPQSLSTPTPELDFQWKEAEIMFLRPVDIPQFNLSATRTSRFVQTYPAGRWTELKYEMEFKRLAGFFERNLYVPCGMTLAIALMSFLLSPANITARLLLCLQAVFFLLFLGAYARMGIPQLSTLTFADQWMGTCFAVAFVTLVLNIVSHRLLDVKLLGCFGRCRKNRGYSLNGAAGNGEARKILSESEETELDGSTGGRRRRCGCLSSTVDLVGLVLLPVLFALFSAYYFNAL